MTFISNKTILLLSTSSLWLLGSSTAWMTTTPPISSPAAAARTTTARTTGSSRLQAASAAQGHDDATQEMRDSIQAMKQQALERLDKLSHQMEELQEQQAALQKHEQSSHAASTAAAATETKKTTFFEEPVLERAATTKPQPLESTIATSSVKNIPTETTAKKEKQTTTTAETPAAAETSMIPDSPDLLDDTWWKIGLDIRREPGTWMPAEWGASGDKLRCQLVVDFTSQPVDIAKNGVDEFFHLASATGDDGVLPEQSGSNACKVLTIQEAWIFPHDVGRHDHHEFVGRTPLPVKLQGAYKVGLHQGPCGTHVVRFYFTVLEDIRPSPDSDIYLPAGRVYATCGYFPQRPDHVHLATAKDQVAAEYNRLLRKEQELQLEMEQQENNLLSVEQIKRLKDQWAVRRDIKKMAKRVQEARQRDPDRDQLRLSRSGRVGLSREGGVCCKVYKGLSMEYRILGRMEVANDEHHFHDNNLVQRQQQLPEDQNKNDDDRTKTTTVSDSLHP